MHFGSISRHTTGFMFICQVLLHQLLVLNPASFSGDFLFVGPIRRIFKITVLSLYNVPNSNSPDIHASVLCILYNFVTGVNLHFRLSVARCYASSFAVTCLQHVIVDAHCFLIVTLWFWRSAREPDCDQSRISRAERLFNYDVIDSHAVGCDKAGPLPISVR